MSSVCPLLISFQRSTSKLILTNPLVGRLSIKILPKILEIDVKAWLCPKIIISLQESGKFLIKLMTLSPPKSYKLSSIIIELPGNLKPLVNISQVFRALLAGLE